MGFVDRGGGREAKGTSLRRSKKNPGAPTTKNKSAHKNYATPTTRATPTPPPGCGAALQALADAYAAPATAAAASSSSSSSFPSPAVVKAMDLIAQQMECGAALHMDTAVALLSRKLEDDQEGIFRRAVEDGKLAGALCWSNEVEKQATLLETCVQHNKLYRGGAAAATASPSSSAAAPAGRHVRFQDDVVNLSPVATTAGAANSSQNKKGGVIFYAVLGIHVNSVDRVNMRLHEQWIKELEENVKHGDVVGVLSGLNLSRDHGTHYAQERLLRECWRVAAGVHLPLVLHLYAADDAALTETVNKAAELLQELLASSPSLPSAIVLYDGLPALQASSVMRQLMQNHRPAFSTTAASKCTAAAEDGACKADDNSKDKSDEKEEVEEDKSKKKEDRAAVPFYVLVTAEGLAEVPAADSSAAEKSSTAAAYERLSALLPPSSSSSSSSFGSEAVVHLSQLLIGTGAPWGTPQNLPDPYLCSLPNEPGNYPYVVQTVLNAMPSAASSGGDAQATTRLTEHQLAAHAFANQLRVFFHECLDAATPESNTNHNDRSGDDDDDEEEEEEENDVDGDDSAQQREWAASQKPAAPTAVAGIADERAKKDLEALLAEAARERERVEEERQREEAAREAARNEELMEKRSRREKKKNVKANNRSNFTHFRNKDFAPRQSRQEKLAHLRTLDGYVAGHTDSDLSDDDDDNANAGGDGDERVEGVPSKPHASASPAGKPGQKAQGRKAASSSGSDDDGDDGSASDSDVAGAAGNSLAAEVEMLLRGAEERRGQADKKQAGKGKNKKAAKGGKGQQGTAATSGSNSATPPPAVAADKKNSNDGDGDDDDADNSSSKAKKRASAKKNKGKKGRRAVSDSSSDDDDDDDDQRGKDANSESDADAAALMAHGQQSRRQRKRKQKRQQQSKGDDSDDD